MPALLARFVVVCDRGSPSAPQARREARGGDAVVDPCEIDRGDVVVGSQLHCDAQVPQHKQPLVVSHARGGVRARTVNNVSLWSSSPSTWVATLVRFTVIFADSISPPTPPPPPQHTREPPLAMAAAAAAAGHRRRALAPQPCAHCAAPARAPRAGGARCPRSPRTAPASVSQGESARGRRFGPHGRRPTALGRALGAPRPVLECCGTIVLMRSCVVVLAFCCAGALVCWCAVLSLCCCVVVLLCSRVVVVMCWCAVVSVCRCAGVLL